MAAIVRVQPSSGGWLVEVAGKTFAFSTQAEAEVVGRQVARAEKLEFLLHGADGVVRDRLAYGGDTSRLPATQL